MAFNRYATAATALMISDCKQPRQLLEFQQFDRLSSFLKRNLESKSYRGILKLQDFDTKRSPINQFPAVSWILPSYPSGNLQIDKYFSQMAVNQKTVNNPKIYTRTRLLTNIFHK